MRALQSCDFCDDDAVGTFEVVPDDLVVTDADQRRVALCDHCRSTLEGVLEPFLDRDGAVADEQVDGERVTDVENYIHDDDDTTRTPTTAAVDANARAEGIAIGRADESGDTENVESAGNVSAERDADENDVDPLTADDGAAVGTDDADETADVGDEPDQFRKVMRLLSNREFPVDRAEFAELTAGAYGMEDDHVARIIDHAVERRVIVDDAGTLKKN
jgi:hypothetical protein